MGVGWSTAARGSCGASGRAVPNFVTLAATVWKFPAWATGARVRAPPKGGASASCGLVGRHKGRFRAACNTDATHARAAYIRFDPIPRHGESVEQPALSFGRLGTAVFDVDRDGQIICLEIIGAHALLPPELLSAAIRLGPSARPGQAPE